MISSNDRSERLALAIKKIDRMKYTNSILEKIIDIYHEYLAGEFTNETKIKFADDIINVITKKELEDGRENN